MHDVCLFAHFDKNDAVDEYVLRYLREIKKLNFSIVFISTSHLSETDVERLGTICSNVILRDNTGLDFGSWSVGFDKYGPDITGRLLLANDSVYGPIGSLASAIGRLTSTPADFYGLVESIEVAPHLQSWFLLFESHVVLHPVFREILAQPFSSMTKQQIISHGEVALTRRLVDAGFCYRALYLVNQAGIAARHHAVNPMHLLWRELLVEEKIPFVKIELLRDNPVGVDNVVIVLGAIDALASGLSNLIKSHLARTTRYPRKELKRTALGRWITNSRYALLRKGYYLRHANRRYAEAWNFTKLLPFLTAIRARQLLRDLM